MLLGDKNIVTSEKLAKLDLVDDGFNFIESTIMKKI